jgi:gamma-glutamyl:cysteine ligase YbdK (ATP-grasp superfamily)
MRENGFGRTPRYSFGIEEEFQLFNTEDLKPYPAKNFIDTDINHELLYNQIEIKTKECKDIDQARKDFNRLHGVIVDKCKKDNVLCIAAGIVPFLKEDDVRVNPYYLDFLSDEVSQRKDYVFNATHVHVSMEKPKEAITVMHGGDYLSPELIAISANSPLLFEKNTGNLSHRRALWIDIGRRQLKAKQRIKGNNAIRKYNIHEYFVPIGINYGNYEKMINDFGVLGSWPTLSDSRQDKGTVQFRHFDQVPDINLVLSFASLARGLSWCLINEKIELYPYSTPELQHKIRQACKYAIKDAEIKKSCKNLLQTVAEESDVTSKDELTPLMGILEHGTLAEEQIRLYNKGTKAFSDRFSIGL